MTFSLSPIPFVSSECQHSYSFSLRHQANFCDQALENACPKDSILICPTPFGVRPREVNDVDSEDPLPIRKRCRLFATASNANQLQKTNISSNSSSTSVKNTRCLVLAAIKAPCLQKYYTAVPNSVFKASI